MATIGCFDCKSTKNLRAIHNGLFNMCYAPLVVSTAKVQKIWEQFTTLWQAQTREPSCFDCKSTKNLRAIHNPDIVCLALYPVVSTAKVQKIWEQFTTLETMTLHIYCCFDCKSTKNLRAIHNTSTQQADRQPVVSTAKVQKIWEQFTTIQQRNGRVE